MLSMTTSIVELDISDVHVLRSGTVYLLEGHGDDRVVVKVEPANVYAASGTFKNTKLAIKAVDARAGAVKKLSGQEIQALADWAGWVKGVCDRYAEDKLGGFTAPPGALDLLSKIGDSKQDLWYKMPLADLTDAERLLSQRLGGGGAAADKSVMKMFADGLNEPDGIEQLGRIIAADMYNSNQDRFSPLGGSQKTFGSKTMKFKTIVNLGNIFVVGKNTQQRMKVSGHDFIDPNTGYKNFDMTLGDVKDGYQQQWLGEHLCRAPTRKKFAKHIVQDLEQVLTPNRSALSLRTKLSAKAASRLERGMLDGMRLIVAAVTRSYSKPGAQWPVSAKERCDAFSAALR